MKKWIVGYVIIIALFGGIGLQRHADDWEDAAVIVSGQIVGAKPHRSSKGGTTYAEVISFEFDGETYQFTRSFSSSGYPKIGRLREVIVLSLIHI